MGRDLSVRPGVVIQVRYPASVEGGAPPDDAMDGVTLVQEELGQIGTVLSWKEYSDNLYWIFITVKWLPVIPVISATFLPTSGPVDSVLQCR